MYDLKVGLQLYSVREQLTADTRGTLKAIKEMGYDYVEMSGGRYGMSGEEMKALLDEVGLLCPSVHQSPTFFQNDAVDAVQYVASLKPQCTVIPIAAGRELAFTEHWDETVKLYCDMSEAFRKAGIQLLYHNHDFEMMHLPEDELTILDRLFTTLPDPVLRPEPDTCWISYGGVDPVKVLNTYKGRLNVVHLKDYVCDALPKEPIWKLLENKTLQEKPAKRSEVGFHYRPVGYGVENWGAILEASARAGAEYVVVEQDSSPNPMEDVAKSRRYLKENFQI